MQRLSRGMMGRYEIPERFPARVNAVQFGLDETLLGVVDPLIDAAQAGVGIAALRVGQADGRDPAKLLNEQDGMYTLFTRGYLGEQAVNREDVVQAILRAGDESAVDALAADPALGLAILGENHLSEALDMAARLLEMRAGANLPGLDFLCVDVDASLVRKGLIERLNGLRACVGGCAFFPALSDGIALRAEAKEAARLCEGMNYADGMIHLVEPGAKLTVQAPAAFRERWKLDAAEGVTFVDDLAPILEQKRRLFDAGLFLLAAAGWLRGHTTLADCMKDEALRDFVGRAYMQELIAPDDASRAKDAPFVIRAFERFENPLNDNALLRVAAPLLGRFRTSTLPLIDAWAKENFEPPRLLTFALSATIMLCAGARPNDQGRYEVLRGNERHMLTGDADALGVFSKLSHDMPPEALAYAALADRELWGRDLRDIDGLEQRVALDIANIQREPRYLP